MALSRGKLSGTGGKNIQFVPTGTPGTVYINHYRSVDPGSPIGGFKLSGYGRELGPNAVKDFMQVKSVWVGCAPCTDPFPVV